MNTLIIVTAIMMGITIIVLAWASINHSLRIYELENKNKKQELENAVLRYAFDSLRREIDFHLHENSDELANSYFANCRELRDAKGTSYSDAFKVWSGK